MDEQNQDNQNPQPVQPIPSGRGPERIVGTGEALQPTDIKPNFSTEVSEVLKETPNVENQPVINPSAFRNQALQEQARPVVSPSAPAISNDIKTSWPWKQILKERVAKWINWKKLHPVPIS